jgi:hypothetical protein
LIQAQSDLEALNLVSDDWATDMALNPFQQGHYPFYRLTYNPFPV